MKPVVTYGNALYLEEGRPALLEDVEGHPAYDFADHVVRTSRVIRIGDDFGEFETLNTIYRRRSE